MPTDDRLDALLDLLKVSLRDRGRKNIATWLDSFDSGSGDVLLLRAPTRGHAIIETGFETRTWLV